jgi:hypothetical protein
MIKKIFCSNLNGFYASLKQLLFQFTKQKLQCVGSEVLTAMVMKSHIFWDIMLCSPLKVNRHCHLLSCWFLALLFLESEDGGNMFL